MKMHEACARHRLGDERSNAWMIANGVVAPERFARSIIPGEFESGTA
jgi:hypothetical protein